jgi:hypothetical protein
MSDQSLPVKRTRRRGLKTENLQHLLGPFPNVCPALPILLSSAFPTAKKKNTPKLFHVPLLLTFALLLLRTNAVGAWRTPPAPTTLQSGGRHSGIRRSDYDFGVHIFKIYGKERELTRRVTRYSTQTHRQTHRPTHRDTQITETLSFVPSVFFRSHTPLSVFFSDVESRSAGA